ncbi:hypothetical protein D1AOALGA4SA_5622 [Olavius algarvensis Delta 1 endosymbiont]|nr:hypothetical protein D1AOALGA4SA_5622 [Olavius algarvensis Delta 1 endosymbiont]
MEAFRHRMAYYFVSKVGGNRYIEWTHKRKNSHYISMIR